MLLNPKNIKPVVFFDYETWARADIKKSGSFTYVLDASTQPIMCAYNDSNESYEKTKIFFPTLDAVPSIMHDDTHKYCAHNAMFDVLLSYKLGVQIPDFENIEDTLQTAGLLGLPKSLDALCAFFKFPVGFAKLTEGKKLMRIFSIAQKNTGEPKIKLEEIHAMAIAYRKFQETYQLEALQVHEAMDSAKASFYYLKDPDLFQKFIHYCHYCLMDVVSLRKVYEEQMKLMSSLKSGMQDLPFEESLCSTNMAMNMRGLPLDKETLNKFSFLVEAEKENAANEFRKVTGVTNPNSRVEVLNVLNQWGVQTPDLKADTVGELLRDDKIPEGIKNVISMYQMIKKTSTAKVGAMLKRLGTATRDYMHSIYYGAATGRFASTGINYQNLPRSSCDIAVIEKFIADVHKYNADFATLNSYYPGIVKQRISDSLRACIKADEGKTFVCSDYSAIEARVLAFLADEKPIIKVFATTGKIYEHQAGLIYNKPTEDVVKSERFVGKLATLAFGYGGGASAFEIFAKTYNLETNREQAEFYKNQYRKANPMIVQFWKGVETIVKRAIMRRANSEVFTYNGISAVVSGTTLEIILPSGSVIRYANINLDIGQGSSISYDTRLPTSGAWGRTRTYGGKLTENIVQRYARDLLGDTLIYLEAQGWNPVLHVHDEVICHVPFNHPFYNLENLNLVMKHHVADFALGLPLDADGWEGRRYKK